MRPKGYIIYLRQWHVLCVTRWLQGEPVIREKPIAWAEEVGRLKWIYLPIAIFRSVVFSQKGNRLFAFGRKPDL